MIIAYILAVNCIFPAFGWGVHTNVSKSVQAQLLICGTVGRQLMRGWWMPPSKSFNRGESRTRASLERCILHLFAMLILVTQAFGLPIFSKFSRMVGPLTNPKTRGSFSPHLSHICGSLSAESIVTPIRTDTTRWMSWPNLNTPPWC